MSATKTLSTGTYLVEAPCPKCGALEEILVSIRSVLTTPEDDTQQLKVRLKGKARDHDCRQERIATDAGMVDTTTGEIK